ncbi:hypothetical protein GGS21DRAFT_515512 [Xylaria nigripes]|nr:hypothetical protein GGS21DRAFT_515512 [Xylaria nigripes]
MSRSNSTMGTTTTGRGNGGNRENRENRENSELWNMSNGAMTLEQLDQFERQLDERKLEVALMKKIRILGRLSNNQDIPLPSSESGEQEMGRKVKGRRESHYNLDLPQPAGYRGRSRSELDIFLRDMHARFYLLDVYLVNDFYKVCYASMFLEDRAMRQYTTWVATEYNNDPTTISWATFEQWLKDNLLDDGTRLLVCAMEGDRAFQEENESMEDFIDRFETIEAENPVQMPRAHFAMRILSRLNLSTKAMMIQAMGLHTPEREPDFFRGNGRGRRRRPRRRTSARARFQNENAIMSAF